MQHMRFSVAMFVGGMIVAASATQPVAAQDSSRREFSPAARAVLRELVFNPDPAFKQCLAEQQVSRERLIEAAQVPRPQWKQLRELLENDTRMNARCKEISSAINLRMLDRMPEADRYLYIRNMYGPTKPPIIREVRSTGQREPDKLK